MTSRLWYIGLTHAGAPLAIRERVQPSRDQVRAMLDRLGNRAEGRLVLNTCERFEVYASGANPAMSGWIGLLADWFHLPRRLVARYAVCRAGHLVAEHLLRVAAGLDSRVLGEPQVLGQLREAHQFALDAGALDPTLAALARSAIRAGRRVRHETPINQGRRSIASLAVDELGFARGSGSPTRVIVLGTGHLARDVLSSLKARNEQDIVLAGRSAETGRGLAERFGVRFSPISDLGALLSESRALIACTSAMTYVVEPATIGTWRSSPLCVVDLCVPRNVDPDVARLPGVRLLHLDELLSRKMPAVTGLAPAIEIVREELNEFASWCRERKAAPLIAEVIRKAREGGEPLSPSARRVLHERIMRIKRGCEQAEAAA